MIGESHWLHEYLKMRYAYTDVGSKWDMASIRASHNSKANAVIVIRKYNKLVGAIRRQMLKGPSKYGPLSLYVVANE